MDIEHFKLLFVTHVTQALLQQANVLSVPLYANVSAGAFSDIISALSDEPYFGKKFSFYEQHVDID